MTAVSRDAGPNKRNNKAGQPLSSMAHFGKSKTETAEAGQSKGCWQICQRGYSIENKEVIFLCPAMSQDGNVQNCWH